MENSTDVKKTSLPSAKFILEIKGCQFELPRDCAQRVGLLRKLVEEFESSFVELCPTPSKDFGEKEVALLVNFLILFSEKVPVAPFPVRDMVSFEKWVLASSTNRDQEDWFQRLRSKSISQLSRILVAVNYVGLYELQSPLGALIALFCSSPAIPAESHIYQLGLFEEYLSFQKHGGWNPEQIASKQAIVGRNQFEDSLLPGRKFGPTQH